MLNVLQKASIFVTIQRTVHLVIHVPHRVSGEAEHHTH